MMTTAYTDPEFFLMGLQRSGTTLLQSIINASNQIELTEECWWVPCLHDGKKLYVAYFNGGNDAGWDDAVRAMHRGLLQKKGRFGLQTIGCQNAHHAEYLHTLYHDAKFVHLVRDPRDTLISTLRTGIFSSPMAFADSYQALAAFYLASGATHHVLRYEDLTLQPVETLQAICDFLCIDYTPAMLTPLTRSISHNLSPALNGDDLKAGTVRPDPSVAQRWRRQLPTLDLLDLNDCFPTLKEMGYAVYDHERATLSIDGEGEGTLLGAVVHGSEETEVGCGETVIDLRSAGTLGVRFPEGSVVGSVRLDGHGEFERAPHDPSLFLYRFDPLKEKINFRYNTWNGLISARPDLAGKRLAVYSAGGATKSFLKEFYARGLDAQFPITAIFDRAAAGSLNGIPIIRFEDAIPDKYDFILITTFAYYAEIKKMLEAQGLAELRDFAPVMFPNQELTHWW